MLRDLSALLMLCALAGCNFFAPPPPDQTLAADHAVLGTQVAHLRQTESANSDRLLITQEAFQTAIRDVELQGTRIAATIVALGTPFVDTARITPAAPLDSGVSGAASTQIVVIPGGAALGSVGIGTPTAAPIIVPTPAPVANPNAPGVTNIVTAASVGANDCAVGAQSVFPSSTAGVYVVSTGINLTPRNVVTYRWQRDSIEVWVDTWSPGGNTNGQCIWYYLTPSQTALQPGAWAVEILVDNVMMGTISFTISP